MAQLQFHQWTNWNGGIDDTNQKPGGNYFSVNVDPYRKPGYLTVADKLTKSLDSGDIASVTEPFYFFEEVDSDIFAIDSGGDIYKYDDGTSAWIDDGTWPHADGNTGVGQRLIEFNENLFWAANTTVGRITTPTGTPTFTDSWQTGLTTATWHPMAKFLAKLFVGHGRNIASWDTVTWTAQDLILPAGHVAKSMAVIGDFLAIGTVSPAGEDAAIFLWDGTSATYNQQIPVRAKSVDAMYTWSNTLWIVAGRAANLHYYNGSTLQEISKIADVDVDGGDSVTVRPGGITQYEGRILIAVNTISADGDRIMPGIWAFDPVTGGFSLMHTLSTGVMNNDGHAYSVFNEGKFFYVGGQDDNTGATSAKFIDKSGGSRYTETCYWTTQFFEAGKFTDKHFRKFYLNFREFPASNTSNEFVVKYRLDDTTRRLNNGAAYTATGGGASTVTIASTSALQVGDEVTIVGGPSAGDLRRITALTATEITVDRSFTATPVNAQTKFYVERWTEIGTVNVTDDLNKTQKGFSISDAKGKRIQFKIELRDAETTGEEVALDEASLSYSQKKPI